MIRELIARAQGRSPQWPAVRAAFLKEHPLCACCGKPAKTVHHIVPFHVDPAQELYPENLLAFCGNRCHLVFGHLFNWSSWNPQALFDCATFRYKIATRPRCLPRPSFWSRLISRFHFSLLTASCLLLSAGCAGPVPAQTRVSLFSIQSTTVNIWGSGAPTNAARTVWSRDTDSQTIAPSQRGICFVFDNMIALPNGGGTATSNSVLSGIEIPLVK